MSFPSSSMPAESSIAEGACAELICRTAEANAALMRGDIDAYRALNPHAADYTLMSPFGGRPTHEAELTQERWQAIGRFFANGTFEQEVVQAYASADMVVLAVIERCRVEVGGLPMQDWPLRVTLVIAARTKNGGWRTAMPILSPRVSAWNRQVFWRGVRHCDASRHASLTNCIPRIPGVRWQD